MWDKNLWHSIFGRVKCKVWKGVCWFFIKKRFIKMFKNLGFYAKLMNLKKLFKNTFNQVENVVSFI